MPNLILATTARAPAEVIGRMPQLDRSVTVEVAAINAVMAGCRPEYFPVVLADFADTISRAGAWIFRYGGAGVVFCPGHAQLLAGAGFGRAEVRAWLAEHRGRTTAELAGARNAGISMVVRQFGIWSGAAVPVVYAKRSAE
ncbi:MAG TPA: hypothetical protein VGI58_03585 [Streptosporangiaceae bacterium]